MVASLLLRCGGSSDTGGKFSIEKISPSHAVQLQSKGMSKSSAPITTTDTTIDGGTINASTTQYFILENIGQSDIDNVAIDVTDVNGNSITGIKVLPGIITVLKPASTSSIIQLVAIEVSHGTPEGSNLGYTSTLSTSLTDTYFTITGTTNGDPVTLIVDFKTAVNLAAWTISTDPNPVLTNTGTVDITLGNVWGPAQAASAINVSHDWPTLVLHPTESYVSGTHSLTMAGGHDSYLLTPLSPFSIYIGNTVCDYNSLSSDAIISSSGVVISYNY
jgi:hypothetical protein